MRFNGPFITPIVYALLKLCAVSPFFIATPHTENGRVPSLLGREGECSVMVLDYCPTCGHTCLVFPKDSPLPSTTTTTDKSEWMNRFSIAC